MEMDTEVASAKPSIDKSVRLLSRAEVLSMVPYTIQHIYRLEKKNKFPRRVRIGANRIAYVQAEVLEWIAQRMGERGGNA